MKGHLFKKRKMEEKTQYKAGFVTLVGKPNVGKSTLLNKLVGDKIAIVSPRPQTTRNIIRGVVTFGEAQIVFIDTPGLMQIEEAPTPVDKKILEETLRGLEGVDVIVVVVEPHKPSSEDLFILDNLKKIRKPVILALNKTDKIKEIEINTFITGYEEHFPFNKSIPISAKKGTNLSILVGEIIQYLPPHPPYYSSDLITDQAERIISATIYTEHSSQKGILIGKKGSMIKKIGQLARKEIENRLGCRIYLDLNVGVKKGWRKKMESLKEIGFELE